MNFNQGNLMPQGSMGQSGYPPQQQQQPQSGGIPQIPPQVRANMTPAQLQQLKSHPQYQDIVRQFAQRQMMLQQQQQQQQAGAPSSAMAQHPGMMQRQPAMTPQGFGGRPAAGVAPPPQAAVVAAGVAAPGGSMVLDASASRRVSVVPAAANATTSAAPPAIPNIEANAIDVPPVINPDSYSRALLANLKSNKMDEPNQWSKQLESEGKSAPEELKEYERVVTSDSKYLKQYKGQLSDSRQLLQRLHRDSASYNDIKQLRMSAITMSNKGTYNNSIWGEGYQGYGNGITNTPTKLLLPGKDITERQINERVANQRQSGRKPHYVPIRLEFDFERDKFKLRDTFLWDLNEEVIMVESFVHQLIDDYKFVSANNYDVILASMKEQIAEYQKIPDKTMGELRVPISVDIIINDTQLTDKFEWDILNYGYGDAEEFATVMCEEMALPGEFATAIAHTIREQTQMYHRALQFTGYSFDGSTVQEEEIRNHLLPQLRTGDDFYTVLRNSQSVVDYTPTVAKLTQSDIEKLDKEIERDSRRKRRHNLNEDHLASLAGGSGSARGSLRRMALHTARGGASVPDLSDIPKTFRTPAPSSVLPGAADVGVPGVYDYTEVFVNKTQIRNPDYSPPLPPDAVRFHFDSNRGTFMVKLKFRQM